MAATAYELILMLDPEVEDDQRAKIADTTKSKIESAGELKASDNWGVRRMAYEIDKRPEADYRFFRFDGGNDLLEDLNHTLKITDGVLRFRVFKVPADSPVIVPPDTVQVMQRRDDDDRPRRDGRGGPRRPRFDAPADTPAEGADAPAADATPAEPAVEAPPAEAPAAEPAAEPTPAEPAAEAPPAAEPAPAEAPAEPAEPAAAADEAPAAEPAATEPADS